MIPKNPRQLLIRDAEGIIRFKANKVVQHLFDTSTWRLSEIIGSRNFTQDDVDQFLQLFGYSVAGFVEISVVSERTKDDVWALANAMRPEPIKRQRKRAK